MQFCDRDSETKPIVIITDGQSDACQQLFDTWQLAL